MKNLQYLFLLLLLLLSVLVVQSKEETPEALFRRTIAAWQKLRRKRVKTYEEAKTIWEPWMEFSGNLWGRFNNNDDDSRERLEIVGALEEGILAIERSIFQQSEGVDPPRDSALSTLYTVYAKTLSNLSPLECFQLAMDPHTLLIGVESLDKTKGPDVKICVENAENSLRNAASLDATNQEAESMLQIIIGSSAESIHERKPKEFVAELFDSFADTFDEKLLQNLSYKVPMLVGSLAHKLLLNTREDDETKYQAVMDAGCGTGLAGRYLRPLIDIDDGVMVGVDASKKMLDKAATCTILSGCGLDQEGKDKASSSVGEVTMDKPLYESLIQMDLEDMVISNTLDTLEKPIKAFDLIVAADVFVYFGSLDNIMKTFSNISSPSAHLIFSCELATDDEAPLGWRLLPNGRFAHTKKHAVEIASKYDYDLIHYEEITPRTEKGEPVRGHLFGFLYSPIIHTEEL